MPYKSRERVCIAGANSGEGRGRERWRESRGCGVYVAYVLFGRQLIMMGVLVLVVSGMQSLVAFHFT